MINLDSVQVGDIVPTTTDFGYETLMLIAVKGNVTTWVEGKMVTHESVTGPLFDSWHVVNLPHVRCAPATHGGPETWVHRQADRIGDRLADEDNPMTWVSN